MHSTSPALRSSAAYSPLRRDPRPEFAALALPSIHPTLPYPTQSHSQVRFITDRKGRVLRESIHRPAEGSPGRPLLVSTYTLEGELVRRAKQYVSAYGPQ